MLNKKHNLFLIILFISSFAYSQHRSYTDKYEYRKKRHEVTFGLGASNCLTDIGGNYSVDPSSNINSKISEGNSNQFKFLRSIYDTDLAKSNFSVNAAYIYHFKRKLNFRANLALARVGADDKESTDLGRINRNLNFRSNILEISAITEFYFAKPITGNKFNLKDVQGHKLAPNFLAHWGFYILGGVGGFFFNPQGKYSPLVNKSNNDIKRSFNSFVNYVNNIDDDPITDNNLTYIPNQGFVPSNEDIWVNLHDLHTEGQGNVEHENFITTKINNDTFNIKTFENRSNGKNGNGTYRRIAVCFPLGFGIEKAFNSDLGIKIEAGYRFTMTDYLDDVSGVYADRPTISAIQNDNNGTQSIIAQTMSGTHSGDVITHMHFASERDAAYLPDGGTWVTTDTQLNSGDVGTYGPKAYYLQQTSFEKGFQRGNPNTNDSYMFFNISFYKKFSSHTKWYRDAHKNDRRRIKASF
ncbi:MAG: hypothetical protein ACJ0QN_03835 [Parvicellaceae bacterium]